METNTIEIIPCTRTAVGGRFTDANGLETLVKFHATRPLEAVVSKKLATSGDGKFAKLKGEADPVVEAVPE